MPLKDEATRIAREMARIATVRADMAVSATATNSRIREDTEAVIAKSRTLLKDTAELVKIHGPIRR